MIPGKAAPPTLPDGSPWPRISIVTPSFQQGEYLEETILSVLSQGYPDVEHLVVDGGSTDGTAEVLERYGSRLAFAVSEKDRGQSHAINKGMERATGQILTWLNSDDQLAPGALFAVALAFHMSKADMVAGVVELRRGGLPAGRHLTSCGDGVLPLEDLLDLDGCWMAGQFFYQPEVMFTRAIWERAGGRVSEDWHYSMDYELWLRFAAAGARLHVIGAPVAVFRIHEEQKTAGRAFMSELPRVRDAFLQGRLVASRALRETKPAFREPAPAHRETASAHRETASAHRETASEAMGRQRRSSLRVALVNDMGFSFGAGIGHRRLGRALHTAGHDVFAYALCEVGQPRLQPSELLERLLERLRRVRPDLVIFGNLHGAHVDADLLEAVGRELPVACVMHDLWIITGWCAYPGNCLGFMRGCDQPCLSPYGYPAYVPSSIPTAAKARRACLSRRPPPVLLANSEWTSRQAREALGAQEPHGSGSRGERASREPPMATIRFGVELEVFRPQDRRACRRELGLPEEAFVLMTSASDLSDSRKGLSTLRDALALLDAPELLVIAPGMTARGEEPPIPGMRIFGYVEEPARMATLYGAADLFVGPSEQEAFGMVFVEAAACGTPSLGFAVGGVPEAIAHGVSGWVLPEVGARPLAEAIERLRQDPELI
ncbi:MAG: glycosyltransferase, partial [Polyangia bacterium]|nr:glycosyltransferase [Polyangia bacterium]